MRIPLFVSASGVLFVIALGFAWTFRRLSAQYDRTYVREWARTWTALAVYSVAAGLALLSANVAPLSSVRLLFSVLSMAAAWWHLRSLLVGMKALSAPERRRPLRRVAFVSVVIATAMGIAMIPAEPRSDQSLTLYLIRVMLLAAAWSVAYGSAGWHILRRQMGTTDVARLTLGCTLVAYAVMRALEPLTHLLGPLPILAQFLTFGGLPLLVGMGGGMLITLLEVERDRAVREAEARARAERHATASGAALAAALATSTDPVLIVNRDGIIVSGNRIFFELTSLATRQRVQVGVHFASLLNEPTHALWAEVFPRVLAGESILRQTQFTIVHSQAPRHFSIRFTPVHEDGETTGALVVAHDTTEDDRLRAAMARREEWFRSLIENGSDIIFQVTGDTRIEYASPSVGRILGYDHLDMVGRLGVEYIHPEDVPTVSDALRRSLAHDPTVPAVVPLRVRNVQGEYIPLEGVSRPYLEMDGNERLIVSLRDVRERRRLEGELVAARRLEAIGRLAGGVAHDFNNLLTAVSGNVALLRETQSPQADENNQLDEISQSVQRGAELTRRLLAFAKQQLIEPRLVHIPAQMTDLQRLLRRLIGEHVLLDVDLPSTLWSIRADPTALEQILVNLTVNARDAMPNGGSLRIAGTNLAVSAGGHEALGLAQGDWVRIDVTDSGVGIAPDVIEHIFEPFFTTKARSGGTGLGLATVYGAATQMGGHVRVESVLGQGTTFSLFFPRTVGAREELPAAEKSPLPRALDGETLLLMEDEAPVREVTAKLLRKLGYTVLTTADGESGVALAAEIPGRLDLVVSDIVMPGIHGDVAVERIRAQRPQLPVLFISGFSQEALRWNLGMPTDARLLAKPFTLDDLATNIRQLIDGSAR